ncbi:hypothetical protein AAZX31_03G197800 [Glycine max]|uniref:DUF3511 domain-containing protein n=3 Tax=Glycine subgen. Soja TaxID=1462606 RepID=I1JQQ3_SOYBN|nr:uncharacterized protein LOC102668315 [Glycine max]XP_028226291.1 uncharacterized protein LOC114407408 [Glycine soja]KAG5044112.1 hypothetical protein JHK87_008027 [Glycine soja]KAG5055909.1 hypothetical protein JHK85_008419 [Glycine max]KAG5072970.1 hypothetical protein JHK86_008181 [Glycine max]KAH1071202.1 hypothetical protein GYH30_007989 [Glycine max]KAH1259066.1 hypothetical protein GmHk_03G008628 [Glycine max]|eukprot:XP_006577160.1 uncharacterized protein LOC102668315 [Glycine max]
MESYGSGHGSGHRPHGGGRKMEVVSGKSHGWSSTKSPDSTQASEMPWRFGDPEAKRKKRIAKYKVYGVEGRVKATLKKGLRWIKKKCSQIHGY